MSDTGIRIIGKDDLDIEKIRAEINQIVAQTQKLNAETRWHAFYRVAILWGSALATLGVIQALLKWLQA